MKHRFKPCLPIQRPREFELTEKDIRFIIGELLGSCHLVAAFFLVPDLQDAFMRLCTEGI